MDNTKPIEWMVNKRAASCSNTPVTDKVIPPGVSRETQNFHRQIPGYRVSPLKGLNHLAAMLGVGGIWVKDESLRLNLNSFKVLGSSFAIYRFLKRKLGMDDINLSFDELTSPRIKDQLGQITFATATDGNHGRGVAWAASKLGHESVIYVHERTASARIKAIESYGAQVKIIKGTYDDAVRHINMDAERFGWQIISDTSWDGYEEIPGWVMQGYTTMFAEAQEQLAAHGILKPTHLFVQAGVGALAASAIGFYNGLPESEATVSVVVEPTRAACILESARAADGQPHHFSGDLNTIMAGLACGDPSPLAWPILRECTDVFAACPDYVAAKGMRVYAVPLEGDPFIVSGESGAVTLGALMFTMQHPDLQSLRDRLQLNEQSQVLLINTEGNTDPVDFRKVVWEGADAVPMEYTTFGHTIPGAT